MNEALISLLEQSCVSHVRYTVIIARSGAKLTQAKNFNTVIDIIKLINIVVEANFHAGLNIFHSLLIKKKRKT